MKICKSFYHSNILKRYCSLTNSTNEPRVGALTNLFFSEAKKLFARSLKWTINFFLLATNLLNPLDDKSMFKMTPVILFGVC